MTRKDYTAIAKTLGEQYPVPFLGDDWERARLAQWESDVLAIADALADLSRYDANGNRLFDRDRFLAATGIVR